MLKILIIDDDEMMSRMYKKLLSFNGYVVEIAVDGKEGFKKANINRPDLILLDIIMPKMNGLDLLFKLKNDSKIKAIPVILLTNLGINEELKKAVEKGALGYVTKSDHEPSEVLKIVNRVLGAIA